MEAPAFSSEALKAVGLNGLGFVNMRLCLMVRFYENHTLPTLLRQTKLAVWLTLAFFFFAAEPFLCPTQTLRQGLQCALGVCRNAPRTA